VLSLDNQLSRQLCERAANKQDPMKLTGLANEICCLLHQKFEQTERKSSREVANRL
jgi:hypothetical protein